LSASPELLFTSEVTRSSADADKPARCDARLGI